MTQPGETMERLKETRERLALDQALQPTRDEADFQAKVYRQSQVKQEKESK